MLILKWWPDGQAFNLIHVRKRLLQRPVGTKPRGRHLDAFLLPLVHAPQRHAISWEEAPAHSGAAGKPLDGLALEGWGPRVLGSQSTETIRRRVLAGYYPQGIARALKHSPASMCKRPVCLSRGLGLSI